MPARETVIPPVEILIVDDRPENLLALEAVLSDLEAVTLVRAASGEEALALLPARDFALILLDVQMPGLDGFATAERIRARDPERRIPIIFVTAMRGEEQYVFQGYEAGAVDYLSKPFPPRILRGKVQVFCQLYRQRKVIQEQLAAIKTLEGILPICCHCKKIRDGQGGWELLESYIQRKTPATFSHGICPQCLSKHYPDHQPGPR